MKVILFVALLILNFPIGARSQAIPLARFNVDIYNPSMNQFFDQYKNVDHIGIWYKKGKADRLELYFRGDDKPFLGERYVFSFDGDVYLFNKKYKHFSLPNDTKARLTYFKGIQKLADINVAHDFRTTLSRDSTTYHFVFYSFVGNDTPYLGGRDHRPFFKGDVLKLTKKLEHDFKKWKPITVTDSIIILSGTVDKKGIIGPLKLIEGVSSAYTDNILSFMSKEATSWFPKMLSTGSVISWPVRISVMVNKDGSMKVSIL